jgi:hypothetical protein
LECGVWLVEDVRRVVDDTLGVVLSDDTIECSLDKAWKGMQDEIGKFGDWIIGVWVYTDQNKTE